MRRIGIWWVPNRLSEDDWLTSSKIAKLFFVSSLLVIALTPVFSGVDTSKMTFWHRLPWGLLGIVGPIALFFLWFGMWRYWLRLDNSRVWAKRVWFFILLIGFWWGSVLYYFFVYLPQIIRKTRTES